jgi:glycosyltransferase involved in cell wall biosynthesis
VRPTRIALDVTPELIGSTGVARYTRELRHALQRRDDCEVRAFAIGRIAERIPAGIRHVPVPLRLVHAAWRKTGLPLAEQIVGRVDLVHSLDLIPPPTRLPLVVTVHDLVTRQLPSLHNRRARLMQQGQLAALDGAAAILAVSHSTAQDLIEIGVDPVRIDVTPNGLTALPAPVESPIGAGPFVLAVGTLEPRKGHELLVRAFAAAHLDSVKLVLAGPTAGRAEELQLLGRELGIGDRLTILGRVSDATLAGLYRDATVLCMPSFGEGFGLPVLEAMAAGLPVVASDLRAVREVANGAAEVFEAGDAASLTAALQRLLADPKLREKRRRQGLERACTFTWEATAEATVQAYHSALRTTAQEPRIESVVLT